MSQVCYDRIRLRSRDCESGIPLAYLAGLDECYDTFNADMKAKVTHLTHFVINSPSVRGMCSAP